MEIKAGYCYHISDAFFDLVGDDKLMSNYENGGYRPHFLAVTDEERILWMVPVSSKYDKYKQLYDEQVKKYGRCTKIVLGRLYGEPRAFLIQNAFPISEKWLDHIHTKMGKPVIVNGRTAKIVAQNLKSNLALRKKGIDLFFPDLDKLMTIAKSD